MPRRRGNAARVDLSRGPCMFPSPAEGAYGPRRVIRGIHRRRFRRLPPGARRAPTPLNRPRLEVKQKLVGLARGAPAVRRRRGASLEVRASEERPVGLEQAPGHLPVALPLARLRRAAPPGGGARQEAHARGHPQPTRRPIVRHAFLSVFLDAEGVEVALQGPRRRLGRRAQPPRPLRRRGPPRRAPRRPPRLPADYVVGVTGGATAVPARDIDGPCASPPPSTPSPTRRSGGSCGRSLPAPTPSRPGAALGDDLDRRRLRRVSSRSTASPRGRATTTSSPSSTRSRPPGRARTSTWRPRPPARPPGAPSTTPTSSAAARPPSSALTSARRHRSARARRWCKRP
jgi:hypothetical protein